MYRKMFKLSAEEMEKEPTDEYFTNLFIDKEVDKMRQRIEKQNASER